MKIAFRNFVMTLKRYKAASAINIVGLTMAFAAFYVIMAQVRYELSFNRSVADSERVYLISPRWDGEVWSPNSPRPSSERAAAASPDAEAVGCVSHYASHDRVWIRHDDYNFEKFAVGVHGITESMLDVASFRSVAGDLRGIAEPDHVIISKKTAELLGKGVGDDIYMSSVDSWSGDPRPDTRFTVAGVFDDFAPNTSFGGMTVLYDVKDEEADSNNNWNFSIYVKLREGADPAAFERIWEAEYLEIERGRSDGSVPDDELGNAVRLVALRDIFYDRKTSFKGSVEQGSVSATVTMSGVAVLIVLIAFMNFVNFFFALIPVRLRGVNVCKVFGASTAELRRNFIFEAVGLALCALAAAMYIVPLFQETFLARYLTCSLSLADNLPVIGMMLAVVVAMSAAAALYPAWYITSFNASLAAKAGFAGSARGRRLRTVLVGLQFAVSMMLIVVAASFWMQYRFMVDYDLGFGSDDMLTFEVKRNIADKADAFVAHLEDNPDVEAVTASSSLFFGHSSVWGRKFDDRDVRIYNWRVRHDFLDVMGIRILDGDGFNETSGVRKEMAVSRNMQRETGLGIGDELSGYRIVGVFENVRPLSVAEFGDMQCLALLSDGLNYQYYVRPRAGADIAALCDFIRGSVTEFDPHADEPSIEFFDSRVQHAYETTKRQTVVVAVFALLSVVIALMGVFGIVLFETRYRRREIAVRRVFGASIGGTIWMFDRLYAIILAVCFAMAAPAAAYAVGRWQENFALRAEIGWWVYAASFVSVAAVTLGLVTMRSARAASENPARVLGGE